MTEQEIEQARADVDQLDIEQLRCGVMLQLLKIEELTKERDAWVERHKDCVKCLGEAMQDTADLAAAAKLALDALECNQYLAVNNAPHADLIAFNAAIRALKKAGVQ